MSFPACSGFVHGRVAKTPIKSTLFGYMSPLVIAGVAVVLVRGEVGRARTSPREVHVLALAVPILCQELMHSLHIWIKLT
jgi:hypothetical protein